MSDCLTNIIGLTESVCPCLPTSGKPTDYNESKSGIFIDQLDGFNIEIVQGADDCNKGNIWERMELARNNAIIDYKNNLLGCIGTNYKPRIEPLNVQVGNGSFQGSITNSNQYAGLKITPAQIKGGVLILKRIGILINANVPATVKIYSNIPDGANNSTLIYTTPPIVGVADTLTWGALATPLELPMWSNQKAINYYFVYDLNGTYIPKNNSKGCGCSGGESKAYLQWFDYVGTSGSNVNEVGNFNNTTSLNGIVLDLKVKCRTSDIICSDEYPLDFEDDGLALNVAYAIRFRAAAKLYEDLLSTGVINRYTMLNREQFQNNINNWNNEYMNWVNYLCANSNFDKNDCLVCRTTQTSLVKTSINVIGQNFDWINSYGIRH